MGITSSLIIAGGGAMSATSSIMAGNAQAKGIKQQAEYNASIYDQQAEMIKESKKISDLQFIRNSATARGRSVASAASRGFRLSGSPLAMLIDNETNMQFDKAIEDYNTQVQYNYAKSGATNTRIQGRNQARLAKMNGYSNAFSTVLSTATNVGILSMKPGFGNTGSGHSLGGRTAGF